VLVLAYGGYIDAYQRRGEYSLTPAAFKHTLLIDNKYVAAAAAAAAIEASVLGMPKGLIY